VEFSSDQDISESYFQKISKNRYIEILIGFVILSLFLMSLFSYMVQLFNKNILKKSIENYQIPNQQESLNLIQQWLDMHKSGFLASKTKTESEQAFNDSFFVQILGYQAIPNNPFTIDPKGKNEISWQKADAILGNFTTDTENKGSWPLAQNNLSRVQAVVEIKDAKTSLDKPQKREWNLSPVQQWFKYKQQLFSF